jgi:hypothetical protein
MQTVSFHLFPACSSDMKSPICKITNPVKNTNFKTATNHQTQYLNQNHVTHKRVESIKLNAMYVKNIMYDKLDNRSKSGFENI